MLDFILEKKIKPTCIGQPDCPFITWRIFVYNFIFLFMFYGLCCRGIPFLEHAVMIYVYLFVLYSVDSSWTCGMLEDRNLWDPTGGITLRVQMVWSGWLTVQTVHVCRIAHKNSLGSYMKRWVHNDHESLAWWYTLHYYHTIEGTAPTVRWNFEDQAMSAMTECNILAFM